MRSEWLLRLRGVTVRLKQIPGSVLLLERLRRFFARTPGSVIVRDFDGSTTAKLRLNEHMQSQMFWYGYYSRDIVLLLDALLRPGMTVCDVGANIGEVTMAAARRVGSSGMVLAFEPAAHVHAQLLEHVELNQFGHVRVMKLGLSDRTGTATVYAAGETFHDGSRNDGLGSLFPSDLRCARTEAIGVTTLDDYLATADVARLDLLKIDVEGSELPVLKGAADTLKRFRPHIIIEVQRETANQAGYEPEEILRFLGRIGYRFYTIGRKAQLTRLEEGDIRPFQNVLCTTAEQPCDAR